MKFSTKAIHIGSEPDFKSSGDVVVPIHLATTFARKKVYKPTNGYDYSRSGNPTRHALEKNLAALEEGKYAFAYSSGLAAITNVLLLFKPGDHIIAVDNIYGGTYRLFKQVFEGWGVEFTFVDFIRGEEILTSIKTNTKLIWLESPTNPILKIVDLISVTKIARQKQILTVIDNTFASPYFQRPLNLGVDIVVHSATKYLGGHSDVTAGCVITSIDELGKRLAFLQNAVGAILSPFDSYNLLKGIKTLPVRMYKHEENTKKIIKFLQKHPKITKIYYPGLKSHRGYKIAKKQMKSFGVVCSFELYGNVNTAIKFLESLKLIHIAISLGAVESLIEHPATMTHASVPKKDRKKMGITDTLIRFSVGIEDAEDLIKDLDQALQSI